MKTKHIIGITALGVIVLALLKPRRTIPKGAIAVRPFDAEKYLGKWYEIARLDYYFEKNMSNVTAEYSLNPDGSIKVVNGGYDIKTGEWGESVGKAKFAGATNKAQLKVSFFGPFYSGYNVIALDPEYNYALVAGKNLDYMWLLSRETTMPQHIKSSYLAQAQTLGYDTSELIWTEHN